MSIFSTDSKLYRFMVRFWDLVKLNLIWMLFSIPIVTIGISTIAACSVTLKMSEDREGKVVHDFIREFMRNWKQGLPMSFITIISAWAVYLDFQLVGAAEEHRILFIIVGVVAAYILGFAHLYVYPLLARYQNSILGSLKNSFEISMRFFGRSVLLVIIILIEVCLIIWNTTTLFVGFLVGPAVIMYTVSGVGINIFRELEKRPETIVDRSAEEIDESQQ